MWHWNETQWTLHTILRLLPEEKRNRNSCAFVFAHFEPNACQMVCLILWHPITYCSHGRMRATMHSHESKIVHALFECFCDNRCRLKFSSKTEFASKAKTDKIGYRKHSALYKLKWPPNSKTNTISIECVRTENTLPESIHSRIDMNWYISCKQTRKRIKTYENTWVYLIDLWVNLRNSWIIHK